MTNVVVFCPRENKVPSGAPRVDTWPLYRDGAAHAAPIEPFGGFPCIRSHHLPRTIPKS